MILDVWCGFVRALHRQHDQRPVIASTACDRGRVDTGARETHVLLMVVGSMSA